MERTLLQNLGGYRIVKVVSEGEEYFEVLKSVADGDRLYLKTRDYFDALDLAEDLSEYYDCF